MNLINGLIFGTGLGLITAGFAGLGDNYTMQITTLGFAFILAEAGIILIRSTRRA